MGKYQLDTLLQILQAVHDSNGDPQVVYPLLEAHLDELDENFAQVLGGWAIATLPQLELLHAQGIAAAVFIFSDLIQQFPYGEQADHLEIAIAGYKAVKIVVTRTDFPQDWAIIQVSLGNAYANRLQGDRSENLEQAIVCYQEALEVCTLDAGSEQWAIIQENLGNIYADRIEGDRAENIKEAIEYYTAALNIFTREVFPERWARIHKNLGVVYLTQAAGNQSDNLEAALRCYLASLDIYTQATHPEAWAELHNNLALVYQQRIQGEEAENLEASIQSGLSALQVYTQDDYPWRWAIAQNNLGFLYEHRIRGDFQENQATAIQCYQNALKVLTKEFSPEQWSMLQNNLGSLYYSYDQDKTGENFETAIYHLTAALEVRTYEAMPLRWAEIQNNLGNIYLDRMQGDKAENLECSIHYYSAALKVYTHEDFPEDWAGTQDNLGIAYRLRIKGDRKTNLERSIHCHLQPLEVYPRDTRPRDWLTTQNNLGIAYQDIGQFQNAYVAFKASIEMVELLRDEIITGSGRDDDKRQLAERWTILYQRMVEACLALGEVEEAIAYVERSKTRNLVDLILRRDLSTIFPPDAVSQLQQLQEEIVSNQHQLQMAIAENPSALAQHLQQLRQQRNDLQDRYLSIGSSFDLKQTRANLDECTAIIQWFITRQGFYTFIITGSNPQPWVASHTPAELQALEDWSRTYWRLYYRKNRQWWRNQLPQRLKKLAQILGLDAVLHQLPEAIDQLILIPHRFLHLLPLHALPLGSKLEQGPSPEDLSNCGDTIPLSSNCLLDRFPRGVRYAPSCQLLQLAQMRQRPQFTHLLAVQNPTSDPALAYTDLEIEAIKGYFESVKILKQTAATKSAVNHQSTEPTHCLHFSCHGSFDSINPLNSALQLADEPLTLVEIFSMDLQQARLVTLSACETGLTDPTSLSDEYIGLPSAFLYAGSPNVVSSLWSVGDISTALLMAKFYENLQTQPSVALALNQAQCWLRDIRGSELKQWVENKRLSLNPTLAVNLRRRFKQKYPFQSPYYWAAFGAIGQH